MAWSMCVCVLVCTWVCKDMRAGQHDSQQTEAVTQIDVCLSEELWTQGSDGRKKAGILGCWERWGSLVYTCAVNHYFSCCHLLCCCSGNNLPPEPSTRSSHCAAFPITPSGKVV